MTLCKMAAASFVLNNVLCYLKNKFGKSGVKPLKSTVLDFYDVEDLSGAKRQLISDIKDLNLDIVTPHVPERREGDNKSARTVDDIFTLLTFIDENRKVSLLPCYVANSPDSLPSSRLYEGDLAIVMKLIEKMQTEIQSLGSMLAIVANDVRQGPKFVSRPPPTLQPAVNSESTGNPPQHRGSVSSDDMTSRVSLLRMENLLQSECPVLPSADVGHRTVDWATAAASTPVTVHNRYSVLVDDDGDGQSSNVFEEPRSRKRRRSRLEQRQQRQQHQQKYQPTTLTQPQQSQHQTSGEQRRRGRVMITGKASATSQRITAAKQIIKKAVFCIDNLNPSLEVDDLRNFVNSLDVRVLTCFPVQPRRRRHEAEPVVDRKAFRLCIADEDRIRLLDESKWPDSVVISQWYRLDPVSRKKDQQPTNRLEEVVITQPPMSTAAEPMISSESTDLENTMIYRNTVPSVVNLGEDTTVHHGI